MTEIDGLEGFSHATREWFRGAFPAPTRVQREAWASIARREHTLVVAPTGSGKTLAAFLWAIDRLLVERTGDAPALFHDEESAAGAATGAGRRGAPGGGPRTRILYISPLKALGVDVERNLRSPLVGITQTARRLGLDAPEVRVAVRSGDTTSAERRQQLANPPDILITTPESLYLMLTSQARRTLANVASVIIDEVHAVAASKRGSHLALTLERLDALLDRPAQRIGLSATVRPLDEVARFLAGTAPVTTIAPASAKSFDLRVLVPVDDLTDIGLTRTGEGAYTGTPGAPPPPRSSRDPSPNLDADAGRPPEATGSVWPHIEERIADLVLEHRSTIVFANSRRLAERLTARLNEIAEERAEARRAADEQAAEEARERLAALDDEDDDGGAGAPFGRPDDSLAVDGPGGPAGSDDAPGRPGAAAGIVWRGDEPPRTRDANGPGGAAKRPGRLFGPAEMIAQSGQTKGAEPAFARAHHGSVSKEARAEVEEALKTGRLRCVVATASLELGIDMGDVDLVIQVESPPSVASGLQRVGRAGHQVGEVSRARLFPKHRADVLHTAVATANMLEGRIEEMHVIANPLDVLAQHTIAAVSVDDLDAEEWFDVVRRSAPFVSLSRALFDSVLDLLAGKYPSDAFRELRPRIVWDRDTGVLTARPGAQRLAVTSGGTIPDRGMFGVFLAGSGESRDVGAASAEPAEAVGAAGGPGASSGRRGGLRVGELDEEMVYESRVGDVFALGASSWQITEITHDRVLVAPAHGQPGRLPFWTGDALGRPAELGEAIGRATREIAAALGTPATAAAEERASAEPGEGDGGETGNGGRGDGPDAGARRDPGRRAEADARRTAAARAALPATVDAVVDDRAAANLVDYVREQQIATGTVPSDRVFVVERFRDELGDWRVVLHSPFGTPVHAPWALMISARVHERYGIDAAAVANDDGIIVRIPEGDAEPPGADLFVFDAEEVEPTVSREVGGSALFASRFREAAARALLLPKLHPGKRSPLWQQRMKAAQLLDVARQHPTFPIILETLREVLHDVYDLDALVDVLARVRSRRIRIVETETEHPSPFARTLMFGYVGAFMYESDSPLAERRAAALSIDPALLADLLGRVELRELLDAEVIARVELELQRLAPDRRLAGAEGVADLLRILGPCSVEELAERLNGDGDADADAGLGAVPSDALGPATAEEPQPRETPERVRGFVDELVSSRRALVVRIAGVPRVAAIEDASRLRDAVGVALPIGVPVAFVEPVADPVGDLVARYARTHGPFTADDVAARFGLGAAVVTGILRRLELARTIVSGEFRPDRTGAEWVDAGVLRRIRSRSLAVLRSEVEPVDQAAFARFLPEWQQVGGGLRGLDGVVTVIDQLAGVPIPASAWESLVLPARVVDYSPALLDELMTTGEIVWRGHGAIGTSDGWLSLHVADTAEWTLPPAPDDPGDVHGAHGDPVERMVLSVMSSTGASFFRHIADAVEEAWASSTAGGAAGTTAGGGPSDRDAGSAASGRGSAGGSSAPGSGETEPHGEAGAGAGAGGAPRGAHAPSRPDDAAIAEALWRLAWRGAVTNDSLAPVRALIAGTGSSPSKSAHRAPSRAARGRLYRGRASFRASGDGTVSGSAAPGTAGSAGFGGSSAFARPAPPNTAGRWSLAPRGTPDATRRAHAAADLLLDRYGVVTRGSVGAEALDGGFALAYRVLSRFEESGSARRGYFIEGLGAAQFSTAGAVDRLRANVVDASDPKRELEAVTLASTDPANPFGAALDWPAPPAEGATKHRPGRKAGALVVLVDGELVLYVERGGKTALVFDRPDAGSPASAASVGTGAAADAGAGGAPRTAQSSYARSEPARGTAGAAPSSSSSADDERLRAASRSLADAVRRARIPNLVIERVNGEYVLGTPLASLLQEAGFSATPRGLRMRT